MCSVSEGVMCDSIGCVGVSEGVMCDSIGCVV